MDIEAPLLNEASEEVVDKALLDKFRTWFATLGYIDGSSIRFEDIYAPVWVQKLKNGGRYHTHGQCKCGELLSCRQSGKSFRKDSLVDHYAACKALREAVIESVEEAAEEYPARVEDLWTAWVKEHGLEEDVEVVSEAGEIFFKCINQDCQCPLEDRLCRVIYYTTSTRTGYFYVYNYKQHCIKFNPDVASDMMFSSHKSTIHDVVKRFDADGLELRTLKGENVASFISCKKCSGWKYLYQSEGSTGGIASNLRSHVNSREHKKNCVTRKAHGGGLLSMGFTLAPTKEEEKISNFSPEDELLVRSCHGFSLQHVPEPLRDCVRDVWKFAQHSSWEGHNKAFFKSGGEIQMRRFKSSEGSVEGEYDHVTRSTLFRSSKCHRVVLKGDVPFPSFCCTACDGAMNDQVIKRLIERRCKGLDHNVAHEHEFSDWAVERSRSKAIKLRNLMSAHYRLLKRCKKDERWRQKIKSPTMLELMKQVAKMEKAGFHLGADNVVANLLLENIKNEISLQRTGKTNGYRHPLGKQLTTALNFVSGGLAAIGMLVEKLQIKICKRTAQRGNAEAIRGILFKEGIDEDNIEYVLQIYQTAKGEMYKKFCQQRRKVRKQRWIHVLIDLRTLTSSQVEVSLLYWCNQVVILLRSCDGRLVMMSLRVWRISSLELARCRINTT